jgi:hypothetical protein
MRNSKNHKKQKHNKKSISFHCITIFGRKSLFNAWFILMVLSWFTTQKYIIFFEWQANYRYFCNFFQPLPITLRRRGRTICLRLLLQKFKYQCSNLKVQRYRLISFALIAHWCISTLFSKIKHGTPELVRGLRFD